MGTQLSVTNHSYLLSYPLLSQEFKKTVTDEKEHFLELSSSCDRTPIHQETGETLSITLVVEQ